MKNILFHRSSIYIYICIYHVPPSIPVFPGDFRQISHPNFAAAPPRLRGQELRAPAPALCLHHGPVVELQGASDGVGFVVRSAYKNAGLIHINGGLKPWKCWS